MNIQFFLPCLLCVAIALIIMSRLMYYAKFYSPSYFFWIGVILAVVGAVSLIHPLIFLLILNRFIAALVMIGGVLISLASLLYPVKMKHSSTTNQKIDALLPDFAFNEFHEVRINASPERVKQLLQVTGVKDIAAARWLMKIRGIADEDVDLSDRASHNIVGSETISTPDFNFFVVAPDELITVMILKSVIITNNSNQLAPPEISRLEEFTSFDTPGYVKVAVNFRFISTDTNETILTTETRNKGITARDNRVFGYYWKIIYPGSAIIRRVWLDTIKKKAQR
ncbi:MAG: hypothetical protein PHI48_05565 [Bacteroidales bacterium]|nr:hypothetical protein [Bacteroidales bacterium]